MSILLILRISFLGYLDVINWAKSNTALNVINNPFLKKKNPHVLGIYENWILLLIRSSKLLCV